MRLNTPLWPLLLVILSPVADELGHPIFIAKLRVRPALVAANPHALGAAARLGGPVPIVWLASTKTQVRKAAFAAGVVGVIRVPLPQLVVGDYAARFGGHGGDPDCAVSSFLLVLLTLLILAVWAASALISPSYSAG